MTSKLLVSPTSAAPRDRARQKPPVLGAGVTRPGGGCEAGAAYIREGSPGTQNQKDIRTSVSLWGQKQRRGFQWEPARTVTGAEKSQGLPSAGWRPGKVGGGVPSESEGLRTGSSHI